MVDKNINTFFHGTSEENWIKIQKDRFLWGYRVYNGKPTLEYRYTYLTPDLCVAKEYGAVILKVKYVPTGIVGIDNYGFNPPKGEHCWQFSVFKPIDIKNIERYDDV